MQANTPKLSNVAILDDVAGLEHIPKPDSGPTLGQL